MVAENVVKSPDFICASPNSLKENKKMTEREQFGKWWLKCPVASMAQVPAQTVWDACQRAQLAAPVAAQKLTTNSVDGQKTGNVDDKPAPGARQPKGGERHGIPCTGFGHRGKVCATPAYCNTHGCVNAIGAGAK